MSEKSSAVDSHGYERSIRWWDGFTISLSIPAALFIVAGYALGALGTWTAICLLMAVAAIAAMQNFIYSEMAAMFGDKVGGIALYANQGWRRHNTLVGPLATFGYWFSWSSSLAIYGLQIGTLVQATWFPEQTWTFSTGTAELGFPHMVAIVVLLIGWGTNMLGLRPAMGIMYATGLLVLVPIVLLALAPLISSDWSSANFAFSFGDSGHTDIQTALAWMFVMAWSVYGIESVASFTPEFKKPVKDSRIALRLAAVFVIFVYFLVPFGVAGLAPQEEISTNPVTFYITVADRLIPGSAPWITLCLIAGLMLMMVMTTAAGGRVLHGSAIDGLTIKQLGKLNRFKVPGRAMTLDLVVNLVLIIFVGEALAVIVAGIMGYLLCHILALTSFIHLRRDFPNARRPIRLANIWVPVAGLLALVNITIFTVGLFSTEITGYGGVREIIIGICVLSLSVAMYIYRQVKQDGQKFTIADRGFSPEFSNLDEHPEPQEPEDSPKLVKSNADHN